LDGLEVDGLVNVLLQRERLIPTACTIRKTADLLNGGKVSWFEVIV
jgi:hypothetical protein